MAAVLIQKRVQTLLQEVRLVFTQELFLHTVDQLSPVDKTQSLSSYMGRYIPIAHVFELLYESLMCGCAPCIIAHLTTLMYMLLYMYMHAHIHYDYI